jgi:hypothetical protein
MGSGGAMTDTGVAMTSVVQPTAPTQDTMTVIQSGGIDTMTAGESQPGETVVYTSDGQVQTVIIGSGGAMTDTGVAMTSVVQPTAPTQDTMTVIQSGGIDTMTVGESQPGETVVYTSDGQVQTVIIGSGGAMTDTGAPMTSIVQPTAPTQDTMTVTQGGVTMTDGGAQPGETVVITSGGQVQTVIMGSGGAMTDTGVAMTSVVQPTAPTQDTMTVIQSGGGIDTMTVGESQPGETVVITSGGQVQTIIMGSAGAMTDTAVAMTSLPQPTVSTQDAMTMTQGGVDTMTAGTAQPGETVVFTSSGQVQTVVIGSGGDMTMPTDTGRTITSVVQPTAPTQDTMTVIQSGGIDTMTVGSPPGETVVYTSDGQVQTVIMGSGGAMTDTGVAMTSVVQPTAPTQDTMTVIQSGGGIDTMTVGESQPGETVVYTSDGQVQTVIIGSGGAMTDTGAAMTSIVQPTAPTQDTMTVIQSGGGIDTMTVGESQPGETVVYTSDGQVQTVIIGSGGAMTDTGAPMTSIVQPTAPTQDTMTVTQGGVDTMTDGEAQPGETVVYTTDGQVQTVIMGSGGAMTDTGVAMTSVVQPSVPTQDTMTTISDITDTAAVWSSEASADTMTMSHSGETIVVTTAGMTQTWTIGSELSTLTDTAAGMTSVVVQPTSSTLETISVNPGGMETRSIGGSQPGETVVITTNGQTQTWTIGASMPTSSGSASEMTGVVQTSVPQETIPISQGGVETMTVSDSWPAKTSGGYTWSYTWSTGFGESSPFMSLPTPTYGSSVVQSTIETMSLSGSQPKTTVVVTSAGITQTWTIGGDASMTVDTSAEMTNVVQTSGPQEIMSTSQVGVDTMTNGASRPGETVIITTDGQIQTYTIEDSTSMPITDTGVAMTTTKATSLPQKETLTITQGGEVETVTIDGGKPGQTVVVTMGDIIQTVTIPTQMTGKYFVG